MQVFRALEFPAEMAKQEYHRDRLLSERWNLIRIVTDYGINGSDYVVSMEKLISDQLAIYEKVTNLKALRKQNNYLSVKYVD